MVTVRIMSGWRTGGSLTMTTGRKEEMVMELKGEKEETNTQVNPQTGGLATSYMGLI